MSKYKNFLVGCGQTCQARALIVMTAIGGASVGALVSPLLGEKRGVGAIVGAALSGLGMTLVQMSNLKGEKRNAPSYAMRNKEIGRDVMPLDPNRECPKGSIKLPINCTQGMDARSIACSKESARLGGFRCGAYL